MNDKEPERQIPQESQDSQDFDEENKTIDVRFPLLILRTKKGLQLMENLSKIRFIPWLSSISFILFPLLSIFAIFGKYLFPPSSSRFQYLRASKRAAW